MTKDEFDQLGLYFFASVDLVGSTAFKTSDSNRSNPENKESWLNVFQSFYKQLPALFEKAVENPSSQPSVWKLNGDEILFYAKLSKKEDIKALYNGLNEACCIYRNSLPKEKLGLKICSWIGGTPVINSRIPFDSNYKAVEKVLEKHLDPATAKMALEKLSNLLEDKVDFIGPSIDTGFRLAHHAKKNTHVLSVEMVLLLAKLNENAGESGIYYTKDVSLKGVLDGRDYPLFYSIIGNTKEDELLKKRLELQGYNTINPNNLRTFCFSFIEDINNPYLMTEPYFYNTGNETQQTIPEEHQEQWKQYKREVIESKKAEAKQYQQNDDDGTVDVPEFTIKTK